MSTREPIVSAVAGEARGYPAPPPVMPRPCMLVAEQRDATTGELVTLTVEWRAPARLRRRLVAVGVSQ